MAKLSLTSEQLETMSYGDVAAFVLEQKGKKQKIQDLFKEVIRLMNLPESDFENHIADFFQLLSTDMRFTMVEKGYWDLKVNQKHKVIVASDDEDEDEELEVEETEEDVDSEDVDSEINYDDDDLDDDPEEDDFKDLVIIDDSDDNGSNQEI